MFLTSMLYPLEKAHEVSLNKITLQNEVDILLYKDSIIDYKINIIQVDLDSLKNKYKNEEITKELARIEMDSINSRKHRAKKDVQVLEINKINIHSKQKTIEALESNIEEFRKYERILFITGIISFIAGLIFWIRSTRISEKIKKKEAEV